MDKSKQAMSDLMSKISGSFSEEAFVNMPLTSSTPSSNDIGRPITSAASSSQKQAMGDILKKFRDATDNVRDSAVENDMLFEALQTEITDNGVRIAEWDIIIRDHPAGLGKLYDVFCENIIIASDLRLYEAALRLVKELNSGTPINSKTIRQLLSHEAKYSSKLNEAIHLAKHSKTLSGPKADIAKNKLEEAKNAAYQAKKDIENL